MTAPGVTLGTRVGPFEGRLDSRLITRYAAATKDPAGAAQAGLAVPPVSIVTQIWEAQNEGRVAAVAEEVQRAATGGVHGEHDIVLHRPIDPGERLRTWVEGHGSRPAGRNSLVTLRYTTLDDDDELVAEQWWTTVYTGTTCGLLGEAPPDHTFPEAALEHSVGTYSIEVDDKMAHRYAEVSGDWSPHHFTAEAAQRTGFDRPFLHGLCTMALCAQGVIDLVADGDPSRLRRIAVRFATPTFLGEELAVSVYDGGEVGYAFEAKCANAEVISHGRAELR